MNLQKQNKIKNYLMRRIHYSDLKSIMDQNYRYAENEFDSEYTFHDFNYGIATLIVEDLSILGHLDFDKEPIYNELVDYFYETLKYHNKKLYDKLTNKDIQEQIKRILKEETSLQKKIKSALDVYGFKKASKAVGGVENLLKILDPNDEELDELIYKYLTENYYPDYNWGPELHDFYREDVKKYGIYDFEVNDRLAYHYLGEWDGYDYLYTLAISKWLSNKLTELFNDKWIPTFKRWFEDNSGLEVRDIDMEGRYIDLSEQTVRSQPMMGTINESKFFQRRVDLDKVKNLLKPNAQEVYYTTESYEQFKYELTLRAVEWIMWVEYELGWEELPEQEEIKFVTEVSDVFEDTIKGLYNFYNK
jgi:hypothetical protein